MPPATDAGFDDHLLALTARYLDAADACLSALPGLLDEYAAGDPIQDAVEEIRARESVCDRASRELSAHVANADVTDLGIRLSRVHLHAGQTIALYQQLDEIPNAAERFADELAAIEPPRSDQCLALLRDLADCAVRALPAVRAAVTGYLRMLCDPNRDVTIADAVDRVRDAESDGDALRNELVATAFETEPTGDALVYRELALHLDAILDAMEDVTDQLVYVAGNQPWIDVEPANTDR